MDYRHKGYSATRARDAALHDIELRLRDLNKDFAETKLPKPHDFNPSEFNNRAMRHARNFDMGFAQDELERRRQLFSSEQADVFDAVVAAINDESGNEPRAFYVDGPGGSGKTFLYETLIHYVHTRDEIALACAISGIAASLLPAGTTAHSLFGLPIPMPRVGATSSLKAQESRSEVLRQAKIIVWDEASMIPLAALDCVDRLLRDLCNSDEPFGGKVMLLGGDFRQILPVLPDASPAEVVANTILNHYTMKQGIFCRKSLTQNMRLRRDLRDSARHRDWLLSMGDGALEGADPDLPLSVSLPEHLCIPEGEPVESLLRAVYPSLSEHVKSALQPNGFSDADDWFRQRAILTPRNDDAHKLNTKLLDQLDASTESILRGRDAIRNPEGEDALSYPEEFLHSLQPSGFPPYELRLREGAVVMLIRNIDKSRGLCNGVRLLVKKTGPRVLDVRVLSGPAKGNRVFIPRIPFNTNEGDLPFILQRRQFPVVLAWAITMHKAQGQSLAFCGIYLDRPVFTHGQLYVSASRSTSAGGLRFWLGSGEGHGHRDSDGELFPQTHNVVFRSVLALSRDPTGGDVAELSVLTFVRSFC